ncbi:MAG: hypothetical protein CR988_07325 [Treponema sp.]|nr:MAG: hypothetical protein CR988_07325 [Treponema sp.]
MFGFDWKNKKNKAQSENKEGLITKQEDDFSMVGTPEFEKSDKPENEKTEKEKLLDQIAEISKQGYAFLKENDTANATIEFKRILTLDEHNNYALVGLGDAARKEHKCEDAIKYYTECLTHHPDNNYALFGLADCHKFLKQYNRAIEVWEKYLKFDDTNITVLTRIGDSYRKIRNFDNAKRLYQRVLELSEENSYALIGLGHLYYDFKKYREALGYWQKVLEISGDHVDIRILTSIGNCYRKIKQFDKGVPFFQDALKRDEDNFYALFGLADCYRGLNQQSQSIQYWNRILEQDPNNKVILTRVGDAYRNKKEYKKAEECYQRALDIAYDSYAMLGLAILKKRQGMYEEAITSLLQLIQADRKNYRVYLELADCYIQTNRKSDAINILKTFKQFGIRNQAINELYDSLL